MAAALIIRCAATEWMNKGETLRRLTGFVEYSERNIGHIPKIHLKLLAPLFRTALLCVELVYSVQAKSLLFSICLPVLFAKQVWKIIGHLGGFNGAALMESFSCSALHFITSVCQLYLIYKVSKGQRMWSINLWVGDCTRERGDGRIYHSLTWQDVLQLSLVELEWVISVITLIRDDLSQVYSESLRECAWACATCIRRYIATSDFSRAIVLLHRWDSSLTTPARQKSVDTDGLYSLRPYVNAVKLAECEDFVCVEQWIESTWRFCSQGYMTQGFIRS